MYPTLSDLLKDLLGINLPLPIQMFGFMVAMAFVVGHYVIASELKRKYSLGLLSTIKRTVVEGLPASSTELFLNGLFGFILGFKIVYIIFNYAEFTIDPPAIVLSMKGNFFGGVLVAAAFAYYTYKEKEKAKLSKPITKTIDVFPHELMGNIVMIAAVAGLIGAKIFHNLENWDEFIKSPIESLLSFSGLTFYGGLIVGIVAVYYYAKSNNIKFIHLADACAPGLMLGYGIGRLGCQLSGDGDWGIVNLAAKPEWMSFLPDWTWAFKYPHNVLSEGVPIANCVGRHCMELPQAVFPTPLYESVMALLIFTFLWSIRKKIIQPGLMFSIYLVLNGLERFMIEKIRVNTLYNVSGFTFTQAELISSILMLLGIIGIVWSIKSYNKNGEPTK
jgi:prolipoprotein diacylglyceryl transferase